MSLKRYKMFVREAFQTARADLDLAVEQAIAANAATSGLASSATVHQLAKTFTGFAIDAVDRCRAAAGRSLPRQAHLRAVLPGEVDHLGKAVTDSLARLGHFDHVQEAVRALMAEHTERVLRDRSQPLQPAAAIDPPRADFADGASGSVLAAAHRFILILTGRKRLL